MFPVGRHKSIHSEQTSLCWLRLGPKQLSLAQAGRQGTARGAASRPLMAASWTPALLGCYEQGFFPARTSSPGRNRSDLGQLMLQLL